MYDKIDMEHNWIKGFLWGVVLWAGTLIFSYGLGYFLVKY